MGLLAERAVVKRTDMFVSAKYKAVNSTNYRVNKCQMSLKVHCVTFRSTLLTKTEHTSQNHI